MLFLWLPLLQQGKPVMTTKPLKGAFEIPEKPELSQESWWNASYQNQFNSYYEYQVGLRPWLIRLRNQLYYWLYDQSTTYVTPGKSNQFYSWDYWAAFQGLDYLGEEMIADKVKLLSTLKDSLQRRNKDLLCVIAPNKVRYMPEYLPDRLSTEAGKRTNYKSFTEMLAAHQVPTIDFNQSFIERKDTVLNPLFASTSTHWSAYGMHLGISMVIDSLEALGQRNLINMRYADWVMKDSCIDSDRDMVDLMNLLFPPATEPLAFPIYNLDTTGRAEPARVLIIGDSFFWNFYAFDIRKSIFSEGSKFLYYNTTQMDLEGNRIPFDPSALPSIMEQVDYVVILATESNLDRFPYGFPETYFEMQD